MLNARRPAYRSALSAQVPFIAPLCHAPVISCSNVSRSSSPSVCAPDDLISVRHVPEKARPGIPLAAAVRAVHVPLQLRAVFVAAHVPVSTIWLEPLTSDQDPVAVFGEPATGRAAQVPRNT